MTALTAAARRRDDGLTIAAGEGERERLPARTVVWAAGVVASELGAALAAGGGAELDRAGRVVVGPVLTLPGHPEVTALGDMVRVQDTDGNVVPLPGLARWRCSRDAMRRARFSSCFIRWTFSFVTRGRWARLITGHTTSPPAPPPDSRGR